MATHSSVLIWRIPWTEEPGGLWSIGLHSQAHLKRLSTCTRSCSQATGGEAGGEISPGQSREAGPGRAYGCYRE